MEIAKSRVTIFCEIDDFCKEFDTLTKNKLLSGFHPGKRGPEARLSISEIMTILIMFHEVWFRDFKRFYTGFLEVYWRKYFPNLPSYSRFITFFSQGLKLMTR